MFSEDGIIEADTWKEEKCPEGKKQHIIHDKARPWFGIRFTEGGTAAYIFERKCWVEIDGRRIFKTYRKTLGRAGGKKNQGIGFYLAVELGTYLYTHIMDHDGRDPRDIEAEKQAREVAEKAHQEAKEAAAKAETERRGKYTLGALCDAYVAHLRERGKTKSAKDAASSFRCHVPAELASLPAAEIETKEITPVITEVYSQGKKRAAMVCRAYLSAAYSAALQSENKVDGTASFFQGFGISFNPVTPIQHVESATRDRHLSNAELKAYLEYLGNNIVDQALLLALFAGGQRMAQLLRAEVADFDPDTATLRLLDPKGKRERPRLHQIPLAPVGAAIVEKLVARAKALGSNSLFSSGGAVVHYSTPGKRVSTISAKIGGQPFDLRDIRRTAETSLAELGVRKDIRARVLSHGVGGIQDTRYDFYEYQKESRDALQRWEIALERVMQGLPMVEEQEKEQKVVNLRGAQR
jgi:integrase